jgi:hypothetical protein
LIHAGAINAIFFGDEVRCSQNVPGENVSSVATAICKQLDSLQSSATRVIIYLNECSRALRNTAAGVSWRHHPTTH